MCVCLRDEDLVVLSLMKCETEIRSYSNVIIYINLLFICIILHVNGNTTCTCIKQRLVVGIRSTVGGFVCGVVYNKESINKINKQLQFINS